MHSREELATASLQQQVVPDLALPWHNFCLAHRLCVLLARHRRLVSRLQCLKHLSISCAPIYASHGSTSSRREFEAASGVDPSAGNLVPDLSNCCKHIEMNLVDTIQPLVLLVLIGHAWRAEPT